MGLELLRIFQILEQISGKLNKLESKVDKIDEKMELSLSIQRNHLIRIKNNQSISDDMILLGQPYNDLNPQEAFSVVNNPDLDFIFLDVSGADYAPSIPIEGMLKIPLEELPQKYQAFLNNKTPILIISEDGLRSILACEFLVKKGFFNVNNISGGHEFWPHKNENVLPMNQKTSKKVIEPLDVATPEVPIDEADFDTKLWDEKNG